MVCVAAVIAESNMISQVEAGWRDAQSTMLSSGVKKECYLSETRALDNGIVKQFMAACGYCCKFNYSRKTSSKQEILIK